ncbi:MAG TPA: hypothetical protein VMM76_09400 [Pirellulaceae bacterium]|nr:hypothetical protein [Pirellulaceae bacterium]
MKHILTFLLALLGTLSSEATEHQLKPGDSPQEVMDRAAPGDRLVFLPGLHQQRLGKHRSLLFVDKSVEIELQTGATLKLADGETTLEKTPEITTDHGAPKQLDDLIVGGEFDLSRAETAHSREVSPGITIYTVVIDGEGQDGAPDTFAWGVGKIFDKRVQGVPITGDWQELSGGVKIRFENLSGHNRGSLWFISYDGRESYGIRIGHGLQTDYIENVRIFGKGTIDLNGLNNVQPSGLVKDINACVLVHGRVRNVTIEDITMTDTMRSVMLYGEHTGKFLAGGGVTGGESFDAEDIGIFRTRTINPHGSGYLLGHPSHRGHLRNVRCNGNYMETATTAIEPNFQLDGYEVIGNIIKSSGQAIHCWRMSANGLVADNIRIHDNTGLPVVVANAPGGWKPPVNLVQRNNRNHLSDRAKELPAELESGQNNQP